MSPRAPAPDDRLAWRCLAQLPAGSGFYLDLGAGDPEFGSVTRPFHEGGWRGLAVTAEPSWAARLRHSRPRGAVVVEEPAARLAEPALLAELCERFAPAAIPFARIALPDGEATFVDGVDFVRFRPWLLLVDTGVAGPGWSGRLAGAGYALALVEGNRRYHVLRDRPELLAAIAAPAADIRARELRRMAMLEALVLPAAPTASLDR